MHTTRACQPSCAHETHALFLSLQQQQHVFFTFLRELACVCVCVSVCVLATVMHAGYDMDYTLVHYNVDAWEGAAFNYSKPTETSAFMSPPFAASRSTDSEMSGHSAFAVSSARCLHRITSGRSTSKHARAERRHSSLNGRVSRPTPRITTWKPAFLFFFAKFFTVSSMKRVRTATQVI